MISSHTGQHKADPDPLMHCTTFLNDILNLCSVFGHTFIDPFAFVPQQCSLREVFFESVCVTL